MVWDELDLPLRKEIRRVIRRGDAMEQPGHAAVAAAAAMRRRRQLTVQAILFFVVAAPMLLWMWRMKPRDPTVAFWVQFCIWTLWIAVGLPAALFIRARAIRAEEANKAVVRADNRRDQR